MTYPLEPPIIAIVGATGTGKSALATALARHLGGECVNADSMQFYRGMNIGTAKITAEEMQGVPHHLLDILDITQEASVAEFQHQARQLFADIRARESGLSGKSELATRYRDVFVHFRATAQTRSPQRHSAIAERVRRKTYRYDGRKRRIII